MTDRLALPLRYRDQIEALLREHVPGVEVWAYGSRVNGRSHDGSDLDLALRGPDLEPLDGGFYDLLEAIEKSNIPILVQAHDWAMLPESFHREIERGYVVVQEGADQRTASEWRRVTLSDLIHIKHGFAFKGSSIHDDPQGDILLTPGNFAIGGGFKGDKFKYYDGPIPEEFVLGEGDLLVSMTDLSKQSDTLGYPALVPSRPDGRRYLHNQRLGKISVKTTGGAFARYIYYLLCSTEYRSEVLASATGTTVKHTSPERIKQFRFILPPLPKQRAIAHVLGTLDDKIELNRRMNETLEEMGRALFKSWFVDFEPVRAKMEDRWRRGESLPGLPAEHYDLFPDRLVDSEWGEIPEGWEVKTLGEVVAVVGGTTPSTKIADYWDGGIHNWATPKDLSSLPAPVLSDTERKITDAGLGKIGSGLLPPGTLLLSSRAPIGYLAISEKPVAVNQGFIAMPPGDMASNLFLLYWCSIFHDEIINHANGSTFLEISKGNFRRIPLVLPGKEVMTTFDNYAHQFHQRIVSNEHESHALTAQRDALLPRLVSGEQVVNLTKFRRL